MRRRSRATRSTAPRRSSRAIGCATIWCSRFCKTVLRRPTPGRYWLAEEGDVVHGVALQSPTNFIATLTPTPAEGIRALVADMTAAAVDLPRVATNAPTAAQFAGAWSEQTGRGARSDPRPAL